MTRPQPRTLALGTVLACAFALAVAHGSEIWGELVPCALCLWERWPYRLAAVMGVVAALLPAARARWLLWAMVAVIGAGAALGFVHVGVEFGWWPSPLPECAAPRLSTGSLADRFASMPLRPSKPCDDPTFLIPALPLSMAAMNFLFGLALAAALAILLLERRTRR